MIRLFAGRQAFLRAAQWRAVTTSATVADHGVAGGSLLPPTSTTGASGSSASPDILSRLAASHPIFVPPATNPLLEYLTCLIMKDGEKHKAARLLTGTLTHLHSITQSLPLPILREAIDLVAPSVKVVTLRKPSKNVPSPRPLTERQRVQLAWKWIEKASKTRPERRATERIAKELVSVVRGESKALEKKEELHKQAVVNRANAPRR